MARTMLAVFTWLECVGASRSGGAGPVKETLIGLVEATDGSKREKWLRRMRILGAEAR